MEFVLRDRCVTCPKGVLGRRRRNAARDSIRVANVYRLIRAMEEDSARQVLLRKIGLGYFGCFE